MLGSGTKIKCDKLSTKFFLVAKTCRLAVAVSKTTNDPEMTDLAKENGDLSVSFTIFERITARPETSLKHLSRRYGIVLKRTTQRLVTSGY